jgi:hypothetical protein
MQKSYEKEIARLKFLLAILQENKSNTIKSGVK